MLQNVCSIDEHSEMFFPVQDIAPADGPKMYDVNVVHFEIDLFVKKSTYF